MDGDEEEEEADGQADMSEEEDEADDGEEEEEEEDKIPAMKKPSSILKKPVAAYKSIGTHTSLTYSARRTRPLTGTRSTPKSTTKCSRNSRAKANPLRWQSSWPGMQLASM